MMYRAVSYLVRHAGCIVLLIAAACARPSDAGPEHTRARTWASPVVLFVQPDSGEVRRLREQLGDDDFYVTADDAMWYQAAARGLLDRLGIAHAAVRRGEARFMVNGRSTPFSWRDADRTWFLVVYDGRSQPSIAASIDVRDHVGRLPRRTEQRLLSTTLLTRRCP
ncbi:MAG TPA: hypothetical protein VFS20_00715 [Longimicrobium sp.]|nr:hypothetical protein [Longimicrobium sp.]